MATHRWIRASDQDRKSAAELLSEAYAVGRLSGEELGRPGGMAADFAGRRRAMIGPWGLPGDRTPLSAGSLALVRWELFPVLACWSGSGRRHG